MKPGQTILWRKHELIPGILTTIGFIISTYLRDTRFTPKLLRTVYEQPFLDRQVPFNYWRNIFLPDVMLAVVMFACQCWLNLSIIPGILKNSSTQKSIAKIISLLAIILATSSASIYLLDEQHYRSPIYPNESLWQALYRGGNVMLRIVIPYSIYLAIREWAIYLIQKSRKPDYAIWICNRFTLATFVYLSLLFLTIVFRFPGSNLFFISFLFVLPPLVITYFIALYGILVPFYQQTKRSARATWRLFLATFIVTLPFTMLYNITLSGRSNPLLFMAICLALQWLISIPLAFFAFNRQKEQLRQFASLEKELNRTQYDLSLLRMQIHPHFLFNTLNTLYGTALQENARKTAESIQLLGDMMRFHLEDASRSKIPIQKEFNYIRSYIHLQQLRLPANVPISITTQIEDPVSEAHIEPMILLPFIENAFKHGIRYSNPSYIHTSLFVRDGRVNLIVQNSVHSSQHENHSAPSNGIGLQNVKDRLNLIYEGKHQLRIESDTNHYTINLSIELS